MSFCRLLKFWIFSEEKLIHVYNLLSEGLYPSEMEKSEKLNLKRYSEKFSVRGTFKTHSTWIDRLAVCVMILILWNIVIADKDLFVGPRRAVKTKEDAQKIYLEFHDSPMGGHSGIVKTRNAISSRFYWKGMSKDIEQWVCFWTSSFFWVFSAFFQPL